MLEQQPAVIVGYAADLIPTLVSVEAELHLLGLDITGFLGQHKIEGGLLIGEELLLELYLLDIVLEPSPLGRVF